MISAEHTQSLTAFLQKAAETMDQVNETGEAEIITVNGQARGVLLSPVAYDELGREAHITSIRWAIKQLDAGEGHELHAAMDDIRAELLAMKKVQRTATTK